MTHKYVSKHTSAVRIISLQKPKEKTSNILKENGKRRKPVNLLKLKRIFLFRNIDPTVELGNENDDTEMQFVTHFYIKLVTVMTMN